MEFELKVVTELRAMRRMLDDLYHGRKTVANERTEISRLLNVTEMLKSEVNTSSNREDVHSLRRNA